MTFSDYSARVRGVLIPCWCNPVGSRIVHIPDRLFLFCDNVPQGVRKAVLKRNRKASHRKMN